MFDQKLFKAEFTTGQTIRLSTADGIIYDSCDANIGVLQGKARSIPAILCDGANDTDQWQVMNIVDSSGMFLDHIAIKGAVSDEQSIRLCQKYLTEARQGQVRNTVPVTYNGLKTFLDSTKLPNNTAYFLQSDALLLDAQGTINAVVWDEEGELISHGGRLSQMMLDMAGCDIQGDLLEQVTPRDVVAMFIDDTCEFGGGMFDAMIIKVKQLEPIMQKLAQALKATDNEEFFVKSVTQIEPFKRQNVVNVGAIFEMSDTQTITVLFNNPDTTPSKLTDTDVLTSWKWILNKRDVTAILQPRAVDARKYPQIASRMHQLLAKNHDRFKRAQALKNKDELLLAELVGQVEASQLELRTLQQSGLDIQTQIDAETTRKQQETETIAAQVKDEAVKAAEAEAAKQAAEDEAAKQAAEELAVKTFYAIKNPKPRARKPIGNVTINPLENGQYDLSFVKDGVGGQFEGGIEEAKDWLAHRLMDMGESMSDKVITFADMASKLELVIGNDVLGINTLPENPYKNASLLDLGKGVIKELTALGWEKSGSTAIKNIEVNSEPIRLKFQFDPFREGSEIWISRNNGESIGEFGMPELSEYGVKAKAQEMNDLVADYVNKASVSNEQSVQMNNDDLDGAVREPEAAGQATPVNEAEKFLNDVIAGSVDLLADETDARIEQIGENLDPSLEALFEQAIEVYSQAAIKNAQSMG